MVKLTAKDLNNVVRDMKAHYGKFDSAGFEKADIFASEALDIITDNDITLMEKHKRLSDVFIADMDELLARAEGQWFTDFHRIDAERYPESIRVFYAKFHQAS